jgi:cytochrome oxidase assembly protein ShyY1
MENDVRTFAQVMVVIVMSVASFVAIGLGSWAVWRRTRALSARTAPRVDEGRMERLESAVDAIAIEVERISESQRFLAKLQEKAPSAIE